MCPTIVRPEVRHSVQRLSELKSTWSQTQCPTIVWLQVDFKSDTVSYDCPTSSPTQCPTIVWLEVDLKSDKVSNDSQTLAEQFFSIDLLNLKQKSIATENGQIQVFFNRNDVLNS